MIARDGPGGDGVLVCGVDEVGRGPLAGPVVTAAVVLGCAIAGIRDSKRLTAKARNQLDGEIRARALGWAVGRADVDEIDRYNILQATWLAMQRAVAALPFEPQVVYVDGNRTPAFGVPSVAVVGGDDVVPAISAASIVAKVARDTEMNRMARRFPHYGFDRHKGYATREHLAALAEHGPCAIHRTSFAPVRTATVAMPVNGELELST